MKINPKTKWASWFLLVLLIFSWALYLRLKPVFIRPIIFDEAFTVVYLNQYDKIIELIEHDKSIPPLNYLLVKLMSQVSTNLVWLRIPSVIFSMLGLWLAFQLSQRISKKVGLITLLLLSFSTFQITYAWQVYVYGQLFFLGMLTLCCFFNLLTKKDEKHENWQALGFFLFSVAGFFTHYGFVWTIVAFTLIACCKLLKAKFNFKKLTKQERKFIIADIGICLCLLAYLPIFIQIFGKALECISWFKDINIYSLGYSINTLIGLYDYFHWNTLPELKLVKVLVIIVFTSMIVYLARLKEQKTNYLIVISICNLLLPLLFSLIFKQSIHAERAIIVASFTLTLLFAIFVDKIFKKKLFYLFLIFSFIFFNIANRNFSFNIQEYDLIKQYVDWFRKYPEYLSDSPEIFVYNKNHPITTYNSWLNYVVLDYYWLGYDGRSPLPNYKKIKTLDEIKQRSFYLLAVPEFGEDKNESEENCPNKKTFRISSFKKTSQQSPDFDYQDSLNVYIYECNPEK